MNCCGMWNFPLDGLSPLPAAAAPFPRTVSKAFLPSQLPIATCLSPDGGGGEGGGEGNLSAVAVARVVELWWIGGVRSVDWRWIGGGEVKVVDGRVVVVWWLNGGRKSGGGGQVVVALRAVVRAI